MRFRHFFIGLIGLLLVALTVITITSSLIARGPRMHKIADTADSIIKATFSVSTDPNYFLVVATPQNATNKSEFKGIATITSGQRSVVIPINSENSLPCKGFKNLDCVIVNYSTTNRNELNDVIKRGERCEVVVVFATMPPSGSSIWLRSLGRICW